MAWRVFGVVYAAALVVLVARGQASGADVGCVGCLGCCGCGLFCNLQGDQIMEEIDWYMIIGLICVFAAAVFFGWIEHLETMAGCVK